jgi:SSS family solute:Na+ symporter
MGHNLDAHTFPELLGRRFGSRFIQGFAGIVIFLFMPIYAAAVLKGGADFLQSYFSINYEVALLFFVVVVAVYVWMGGMKSVMYNDALQGGVMFLGMTFLLIFTYSQLGGIVPAHESLTKLMQEPAVIEQTAKLTAGGFQGWTSMPVAGSPIWWNLVSTIVLGVGIGVLAQPQLAVRFMTVKSNRELHRAVLSGGVFILMMTGVAFAVGALSNLSFFAADGKIALLAAGGNDKIIPEFIRRFVPEWFGPIFLLTLLAAAMSTLSSQFHTMGAAVSRDIYEGAMRRKGNPLLISRIGLLIGVLFATILAWLTMHLDVSLAIIASGTALFFGLCAASFLPAYIGALYWKKLPEIAARIGMVTGFSVGVFWIFFVNKGLASKLQICKLLFDTDSIADKTVFAMIDPILIALPISFLVTLVAWRVFRGRTPDTELVKRSFEGIG